MSLKSIKLLDVKELRNILLNSGIIKINNISVKKISKDQICNFLYDKHIKSLVTLKKDLYLNKNYSNFYQYGGHNFIYNLEDVLFIHMTQINTLEQIIKSGKIIAFEDDFAFKDSTGNLLPKYTAVYTCPSIPDLGKRKFYTHYGYLGLIIKCSDWTKYIHKRYDKPNEDSVNNAFNKMLVNEKDIDFFNDEFKYPEIPIKNVGYEHFHRTEIIFPEDIPLSNIIGVFVLGTLISHKEYMEQIKNLIMPLLTKDLMKKLYVRYYDNNDIDKLIKKKLDIFERLFSLNETEFYTLDYGNIMDEPINIIEGLYNIAFDRYSKYPIDPKIKEDIINLTNIMLEFKKKSKFDFDLKTYKNDSYLNDNTKSMLVKLCKENNIPLYDNVFCHEDLHNKLKMSFSQRHTIDNSDITISILKKTEDQETDMKEILGHTIDNSDITTSILKETEDQEIIKKEFLDLFNEIIETHTEVTKVPNKTVYMNKKYVMIYTPDYTVIMSLLTGKTLYKAYYRNGELLSVDK